MPRTIGIILDALPLGLPLSGSLGAGFPDQVPLILRQITALAVEAPHVCEGIDTLREPLDTRLDARLATGQVSIASIHDPAVAGSYRLELTVGLYVLCQFFDTFIVEKRKLFRGRMKLKIDHAVLLNALGEGRKRLRNSLFTVTSHSIAYKTIRYISSKGNLIAGPFVVRQVVVIMVANALRRDRPEAVGDNAVVLFAGDGPDGDLRRRGERPGACQ